MNGSVFQFQTHPLPLGRKIRGVFLMKSYRVYMEESIAVVVISRPSSQHGEGMATEDNSSFCKMI